jgi:hypothetical protein
VDDELPNRIQAWFEARCAAIFTRDEIDIAADEAKRRDDRLVHADRMAELMALEYDDRQRLGIFTIGAIDKTKRQRANLKAKRKREQARASKEAKRRERGKPNRKEYLAASLSRTQPWKAEGISRAAWYRRRETSVSPPHRSLPSEQPVSKRSEATP